MTISEKSAYLKGLMDGLKLTTEIYTLSLHDALPICYSGDRR